jgi:hypothetical protein
MSDEFGGTAGITPVYHLNGENLSFLYCKELANISS